jgi:hypothetical protein
MSTRSDSPEQFATPQQGGHGSPTNSLPPNGRRFLDLTGGSALSSLTGPPTSASGGDTGSEDRAPRRRFATLGLSSDEDDDDEFDNLDTGDLKGPKYLYRRPHTNRIVEADMLEEENENGDGGDSDEEGEEGVAMDEAACEAL